MCLDAGLTPGTTFPIVQFDTFPGFCILGGGKCSLRAFFILDLEIGVGVCDGGEWE